MISAYNYNFTSSYANGFWFVLKAESGSDKGDYEADIILSYYEYDPNCADFTNWNGEECEPDFDAYCASM